MQEFGAIPGLADINETCLATAANYSAGALLCGGCYWLAAAPSLECLLCRVHGLASLPSTAPQTSAPVSMEQSETAATVVPFAQMDPTRSAATSKEGVEMAWSV